MYELGGLSGRRLRSWEAWFYIGWHCRCRYGLHARAVRYLIDELHADKAINGGCE